MEQTQDSERPMNSVSIWHEAEQKAISSIKARSGEKELRCQFFKKISNLKSRESPSKSLFVARLRGSVQRGKSSLFLRKIA
nr:MAG TPA: hypothetical protein [Caudoviricetes sp.]